MAPGCRQIHAKKIQRTGLGCCQHPAGRVHSDGEAVRAAAIEADVNRFITSHYSRRIHPENGSSNRGLRQIRERKMTTQAFPRWVTRSSIPINYGLAWF